MTMAAKLGQSVDGSDICTNTCIATGEIALPAEVTMLH